MYLQSSNRDTEVENNVWIPWEGGGWWDELGDWDWHICTTNTMYKLD